MRNLFFLIIIIILGLFQATFLNYLKLFSTKPDLLIIMVVLAAVFLKPCQAVCLSIFAGFLKDIFSASNLGINIFLFLIWGLAVAMLSRKISIDDNYALMAVVFIIVLLNSIICRFIFLSFNRVVPLGVFLRIILIESLYTSFCLPVLYNALNYFKCFASLHPLLSPQRGEGLGEGIPLE